MYTEPLNEATNTRDINGTTINKQPLGRLKIDCLSPKRAELFKPVWRSVNQKIMDNKLVTYAANNRTYDPADIMGILLEISRDEAIIFLTWNDPNGVYMDLDCRKEGTEPLQETEAKLLCFKQLMENSEIPVNSKQAKCEQLLTTICKKVMAYEDYSDKDGNQLFDASNSALLNETLERCFLICQQGNRDIHELTIEVDTSTQHVRLLKACQTALKRSVRAFNSIPNKRICAEYDTYSIASEIDNLLRDLDRLQALN